MTLFSNGSPGDRDPSIQMKQIYFLAGTLFVVAACARTVVPRADVQYVDSKDGVITVIAQGYGINRFELQEHAERSAFETLLFRGVPGSQQTLPLISEEQQVTSRSQPGYLRVFFDDKKYQQFITHSAAQGQIQTTRVKDISGIKRDRSQSWLIGINLPALRRDMEANHLIRKFGY